MDEQQRKAWEYRLEMEIMPDAYNEDERAISWYYYLEEHLTFPFKAECIELIRSSPLRLGEKVKVTGLLPDKEFERTMLVMVQWQRRELAVPLEQLRGIDVDADTEQAMADWQQWTDLGYEF